MTHNNQQLRQGTALRGKQDTYTIQRVLGQGGFGITYLATTELWMERDLGRIKLKTNVAIKEFFMKNYCERDSTQSTHITVANTGGREQVDYYRNRFTKEANNVSKLQHENIVRVLEVFEANNTVYIAMEYIEGASLAEYVRAHGALPEAEALGCIRQVAAALDYTHSKSITHLDLKPANILRQPDGTIKVIDFGLSKQYNAEGEVNSSSINPAGITEGYSPLELYSMGSLRKFTPASDIYSLGATLYFLLTAQTPPNAADVSDDGLPPLPAEWSKPVQTCITQAMQPRRKDRPQSIAAFLALLDGSEVVVDGETKALQKEDEETQDLQGGKEKPQPQPEPDPQPEPEPQEPLQPLPNPEPASPAPPKKPANHLALIVTGVIVGVLLVLGFFLINPSGQSSGGADLIAVIDSAATTPPATTPTPTPTPAPVSEPAAEPEAKPQPKAEPKPEAKPQPKAEPKPEAKPQPATPSRQSFEPEMVYVQGGTFMMGSPTSEANHESDEVQHQVTVSSFRIGKYEVTQGQWEAVMGSNPSKFKKGDNYPVENVSWNDIQTFLQKLNAATGKRYRLPTEAEWEYAARGGSRSNGYIYSGSNSVGNVAWYSSNSGDSTHPVGQKSPNELGIYDMTGNVWEWCSDWYGSYPTSAQTNPKGASTGSDRVLRGGGWGHNDRGCRSAFRGGVGPGLLYGASAGFRVAAPL